MFRQPLASGLAIPFFERLVGNPAFDEKLRELPALRLALEWHGASRPGQIFRLS
jgi:hypothetical protein